MEASIQERGCSRQALRQHDVLRRTRQARSTREACGYAANALERGLIRSARFALIALRGAGAETNARRSSTKCLAGVLETRDVRAHVSRLRPCELQFLRRSLRAVRLRRLQAAQTRAHRNVDGGRTAAAERSRCVS